MKEATTTTTFEPRFMEFMKHTFDAHARELDFDIEAFVSKFKWKTMPFYAWEMAIEYSNPHMIKYLARQFPFQPCMGGSRVLPVTLLQQACRKDDPEILKCLCESVESDNNNSVYTKRMIVDFENGVLLDALSDEPRDGKTNVMFRYLVEKFDIQRSDVEPYIFMFLSDACVNNNNHDYDEYLWFIKTRFKITRADFFFKEAYALSELFNSQRLDCIKKIVTQFGFWKGDFKYANTEFFFNEGSVMCHPSIARYLIEELGISQDIVIMPDWKRFFVDISHFTSDNEYDIKWICGNVNLKEIQRDACMNDEFLEDLCHASCVHTIKFVIDQFGLKTSDFPAGCIRKIEKLIARSVDSNGLIGTDMPPSKKQKRIGQPGRVHKFKFQK